MRPLRLCVKLSALTLFLTACSSTEEPEKEKPEPQDRPAIVGRVASVRSGNSFVLIQSYGDWTVTTGTILTTRGADERAANLLVTGEKLGQFAAADIQSGEVKVGDAVLRLPAQAPRSNPQPAETESPVTDGVESP